MTEQSLPWDGQITGDCGAYSHLVAGRWVREAAADYATASARGPLWTDQRDSLLVAQHAGTPDMSVDVSVGSALVDVCFYWSDAVATLAVTAAHATLNRIDRVILRLDNTNQTVRLAVKAGTPGASPVPPALVTDRLPYFEIPLAQIYVGATVTQILDTNLTDERNWANIVGRVYTRVTNKSGGGLAVGDVVTWSDATAKSVTTTTTADDPQVAGVVADPMAADAEGRICTLGVHPVKVAAAVGIGNVLATSTTVKMATNQGANAIARALAATAGAGLVQAFVNVKPVYPSFSQKIVKGVPYVISTNVWTDIDATNLALTITTHGGPVDINFSTTCIAVGADGQFTGFDFTVDGTRFTVREGLTLNYGLRKTNSWYSTGNKYTLGYAAAQVRVTGLAPGSHTFKLQWMRASSPGVDVNITADDVVVFSAREVLN